MTQSDDGEQAQRDIWKRAEELEVNAVLMTDDGVSTAVQPGDDATPERETRVGNEVGGVDRGDGALMRRQQRVQVMPTPLVHVSSDIDSVKVHNKPVHYREGRVLTPPRVRGDISAVANEVGELYTDNLGVQVVVGMIGQGGGGCLRDTNTAHAPRASSRDIGRWEWGSPINGGCSSSRHQCSSSSNSRHQCSSSNSSGHRCSSSSNSRHQCSSNSSRHQYNSSSSSMHQCSNNNSRHQCSSSSRHPCSNGSGRHHCSGTGDSSSRGGSCNTGESRSREGCCTRRH